MRLQAIYELMGGSALIFACRLAGAVIVFVSQLLLARWMGAHELGIYVLAFSWCLLISTFTGLGLPAASLKFIGECLASGLPGRIKGYVRFSRLSVVGFSSAVAVIACAGLILAADRLPTGYSWPLVIAMLLVPAFTLQRLHDKFAHAFSWFTLAFLPSMAVRPALFLLFVLLAQSQWELNAVTAMMLQLLAVIAVMVTQHLFLQSRISAATGGASIEYGRKNWTRTALPLLVSTLFVQYFPELTVVIIGALLPAEDVAVFYACFRIALFIGFGLTAVNALLIPKIPRLHAEGELQSLQREIGRTTQIKFCCALAALVLLALLGEPVLALFGDEFVVGYPTLLVLAASQVVISAAGPVDVLLNLTGHQDRCLVAFCVALPVALLLNMLLVPLAGIQGAALAVLLTIVFWNIWLYRRVVTELGLHPSILAAFRR